MVRDNRSPKKETEKRRKGEGEEKKKTCALLRIWRMEKRISEEIGVPSREITLNFVLTKHAPLFIL